MGMDSETRELLTLWRELSPKRSPACSKRRVTWLSQLGEKRRPSLKRSLGSARPILTARNSRRLTVPEAR